MITRRFFGRTAALTVLPIRVSCPAPVTVSWWTAQDLPRVGLTAYVYREHVLRMSASKQATHVTGITIASANLKPAPRDVTPTGGWSWTS